MPTRAMVRPCPPICRYSHAAGGCCALLGPLSAGAEAAAIVRTASDGAHATVPATGKATTGVFHCVCGRSFAAACTYETHYSMWFNVQCPDAVISVLLWRSKDNPYD